MGEDLDATVLNAFRRAADGVPAYGILLKEAGIESSRIRTMADFANLPVLEKGNTFKRFGIAELSLGGKLGRLGSVLTSSGHSGQFAFGLTSADALPATVQWIDDSLDTLFQVRSNPTLLINCLPMGVKIPTLACTLAETSVRPDMVIGLVKAFGSHYAQIVLVGEAAFIKNVLETGARAGVSWAAYRVQVIVGEEPLAENARRYLQFLLGQDPHRPDRGVVFSSMGVAELGLNLFFEIPPARSLIPLRAALHENEELRRAFFADLPVVPSLFTYDPRRIYVECDAKDRLIVTTLDPAARVPLIRYATGDCARKVALMTPHFAAMAKAGVNPQELDGLPIIAILGRGENVLSGEQPLYPESVKEGIYHDPELAASTTANFRLVARKPAALVRIQLSPGIETNSGLEQKFAAAIRLYSKASVEVRCETYSAFGSGMTLDYERKFNYLGR